MSESLKSPDLQPTVSAHYDRETDRWFSSSNVPGLIIEARTLDEFWREIADVFPALAHGLEDVDAECAANSRLIAAAPNMAALLEELATDLSNEVRGRHEAYSPNPAAGVAPDVARMPKTVALRYRQDMDPVERARALLSQIKGERDE